MKELAICLALLAAGFLGGVALMTWNQRREIKNVLEDTSWIETRRKIFENQAHDADQDAGQLGHVVAEREQEVARLRQALRKTEGKLDVANREPLPVEDGPRIVALESRVAALTETVDAQKNLIQAQDASLQGVKAQLVTMTAARDAWKRTSEEGGREAVQLRAALAAKEGLEKSALWRGRLQGLAIGIGAGYLGGRIK